MEEMDKPKKQLKPKPFNASQKAQAVLTVWTERRKPLEICREMGVSWTILDQWQKRAMEGMLQALESNVNLENGAALSPRLQALLERKKQPKKIEKLPQRLKMKEDNVEK